MISHERGKYQEVLTTSGTYPWSFATSIFHSGHKEVLIGTTSSRISYILRAIYTPYAGAAGMLLHINGKFTMGKLKSSLLS